MGRRREMEDAVAVAPPGWLSGEYTFFGVYDGQGGAKAAETSHECLEKCVVKARELPNKFEWENVMVECFGGVEETMTGSAVVVVVGEEEIVVADYGGGGSRAVLCRGGAVVPLSRDHKPNVSNEKENIEATIGGTIVNQKGSRVQGVRATTRLFGNRSPKQNVTSEPEVTVMARTEADMFMVIATDGLWDVVSNEVACEFVKNWLSGKLKGHTSNKHTATEAAAMLAQHAVGKGSKDNISIIVVLLQ